MPKIIVRADTSSDRATLVTLSERIVAENLISSHYTSQLMERISWAAADAEALEAKDTGDEATPTARPRTPAIRAA